MKKERPSKKVFDHKEKGRVVAPNSSKESVKSFKCKEYDHYQSECPTWRVMTIGEIQHIEAEIGKQSKEPIIDEEEEESVTEEEEATLGPVEGTSLMSRRALHASKETESQREKIFHTQGFVQGKVCSLIIDGGSEINVASQTMIDKLNHKVIKHPRPYKLYWLNNGNAVNVNKQALITISF